MAGLGRGSNAIREVSMKRTDVARPGQRTEQPSNKNWRSEVNKSNDVKRPQNKGPEKVNYSRPAFRPGMRDKVWENAKDEHGRVRDPLTGKYMSKNKPWDMGHKPGYEFAKHKESAERRGIDRKQFIDEYNNPDHYRPELPSSNRSHKGENKTSAYFGD
ncbi:MAG: hypothetical protein HFH68_03430 [Lachnospiraceae bacterium]|nr:hypothetical protein [Lachnospiraceae bacterium]